MTALTLYGRPVDGTIPVTALLYDDESLVASQDAVGLYDGPNKSPPHQSGTVHVTSHRLFYISGASSSSAIHAPSPNQEGGASLALDLQHVSHTDSYAGFFKSSPKVTLHLRQHSVVDSEVFPNQRAHLSTPLSEAASTASTASGSSTPRTAVSTITNATSITSNDPFEVWDCEICGNRNPPGLSPTARHTCQLCGMPRSVSSPTPSSSKAITIKAPTAINAPGSSYLTRTEQQSVSLPSSASHTPAPTSTPSSFTNSNLALGRPRNGTEATSRRSSTIPCPACTFLNHPYLPDCEMCGTSLSSADLSSLVSEPSSASQASSQPRFPLSKSAPTSRPGSPDLDQNLDDNGSFPKIDDKERYIRLSFRKGGDKAFYAALKTALQGKAWDNAKSSTYTTFKHFTSSSGGFSGIRGLMHSAAVSGTEGEGDIEVAFSDLETLMAKAQNMVRLAKDLNEQLTVATARSSDPVGIEPEEATFVRSSLAQLGLSMQNAPITADMSRDERMFNEQLAKELGGVLLGRRNGRTGNEEGFMKKRGIVGLDEVWGAWNRARGVSLVSPEQALKALQYLPQYTEPPIHSRTLASGLRVLHTPDYGPTSFSSRVIALIVEEGPLSTMEVATKEGLNIGLIEELMLEVEGRGDVCRDDAASNLGLGKGGGGTTGVEIKWCPNAFIGYVWDGQQD